MGLARGRKQLRGPRRKPLVHPARQTRGSFQRPNRSEVAPCSRQGVLDRHRPPRRSVGGGGVMKPLFPFPTVATPFELRLIAVKLDGAADPAMQPIDDTLDVSGMSWEVLTLELEL